MRGAGSLTAYNPPMALDVLERASHEKRLAALGSVGSAVLLVSLKMFIALRTGSLGILSEALHSILDLVAAVITYLSVRVADKPADADHLYGHGKVESFSAFVETGLLLVTAVYIIWEAFQRLLFHTAHMRPSLQAIVILAVCMGIDFVRSRALKRVAEKYPSEALEADALHFSTDVWSTFVVILGITAAWLGARFGIAWLDMLDAVAALGVAGVIIWIGSRLGRRTVDALLDVAPRGLRERIDNRRGRDRRRAADRTRARAPRRAALFRGCDHQRSAHREPRAGARRQRRRRTQHRADRSRRRGGARRAARATTDEHLFETIRAIAQRRGLAVHELSAHQFDARLFIELHLEVDEGIQPARGAPPGHGARGGHRQAPPIRSALRQYSHRAARREDRRRRGDEGARARRAGISEFAAVRISRADRLPRSPRPQRGAQNPRLLPLRHGRQPPITEVHDITAALEDRVKEHFPQIFRLTIHPEPVEES